MNPTVLVIALVIVGAVAGKLLMRRFPTVSYTQIFCAISAWVAGLSLFVRQSGGVLVLLRVVRRSDRDIAVVFLIRRGCVSDARRRRSANPGQPRLEPGDLMFLRRLDTPRPTGPV